MFYASDLSLQLSWLAEHRMEVKIGRTRRIIQLTPTTNIPGLSTPCLFKGKIEGDQDSEVSVSGCQHSKETSVSIASDLLTGGIVDLMIEEGKTKKMDDRSIAVDLSGREGNRMDYSTADYVFPTEDPFPIGHLWSYPSLPSRVLLKTNIKYDNSLLEHFDNSHKKTEDWINAVVQFAKPRMFHKSLTIRVVLEIGEVSHINETLKATREKLHYLRDKLEKTREPLTSYFCKDIGRGLNGYAFIGAACDSRGQAININELYSTTESELKTARTFAHELGHNIGME